MTTITLEVPDELAAELKMDAAVIPQLLREVVTAKWDKLREASKPLAPGQPPVSVVVWTRQLYCGLLSAAPAGRRLVSPSRRLGGSRRSCSGT